jgi:RNA polymerase sigma-70 factor (ECF subfamily)
LIDTHRRYVDARQRDVRREVSLDRWASSDTTSSGLAAHLADSATSPSQQAARREMIADLRAVLDRLDEIDREILVLRHLEELSNNEVAAILGIDKFAASKRYLRALGRLRTAMLAGAEGREHDGMGAGA